MSGALGTPTGQSNGLSVGASAQRATTYSFTTTLVPGTTQTIDLRALQNINVVQDVQGIHIDNSLNASAVYVVSATGQTLTCPPYSWGQAPFYCPPGSPVFTMTGNGTISVALNNFPTPLNFVSATNQAPIPVVGGYAQTQDITLASSLQNGLINMSPASYGNGDSKIHNHVGIAYQGTLTVGTPVTVASGTTGSAAFINAVKVWMDANAAAATAGTIEITVAFANAGTIAQTVGYVGTSAPTGNVPPVVLLDLSGLNLLGTNTGDSLTISATGTSLTTGSLRYTAIAGVYTTP